MSTISIKQGKRGTKSKVISHPLDVKIKEFLTSKPEFRIWPEHEILGEKLEKVGGTAALQFGILLKELETASRVVDRIKNDVSETGANRALLTSDYINALHGSISTHLRPAIQQVKDELKLADESSFFKQNMNKLSQLDIAMLGHLDLKNDFSLFSFAMGSQPQARIALHLQNYSDLVKPDIDFNGLIDAINEKFSPESHARQKFLSGISKELSDFDIQTTRGLDKLNADSTAVSEIRKRVH